MTYVDCNVLERGAFEEVCEEFPEEAVHIHAMAEERLKREAMRKNSSSSSTATTNMKRLKSIDDVNSTSSKSDGPVTRNSLLGAKDGKGSNGLVRSFASRASAGSTDDSRSIGKLRSRASVFGILEGEKETEESSDRESHGGSTRNAERTDVDVDGSAQHKNSEDSLRPRQEQNKQGDVVGSLNNLEKTAEQADAARMSPSSGSDNITRSLGDARRRKGSTMLVNEIQKNFQKVVSSRRRKSTLLAPADIARRRALRRQTNYSEANMGLGFGSRTLKGDKRMTSTQASMMKGKLQITVVDDERACFRGLRFLRWLTRRIVKSIFSSPERRQKVDGPGESAQHRDQAKHELRQLNLNKERWRNGR